MARQSASTPVKAENYVMSESPHHGPGYDTAYGSPGSGHWEHDGAQVEGHPTYPPPSHVPSYVRTIPGRAYSHTDETRRSGASYRTPTRIMAMPTW